MLGIIINPRSGNGRGKSVWDKVEAELKNKGIVYISRMTSRAGEASKIANELIIKDSVHTLIVIGGDGTINEAADGIVSSGDAGKSTILASIPAGTGDDFAKAHGISNDSLKALHHILSRNSVSPIDVLHSEGRSAVNCIGSGFDAEVARQTNASQLKKRLNRIGLGSLTYFIIALRVFLTFKPSRAVITVDGQSYTFPSLWLVAVMNIPYFGGSMHICPGADPRDGQADIVAIRGESRLKLLPILMSIYKGTHIGHPAVTFLRGTSIRIETDRAWYAHADGEALGETPLHITVLPSRLNIT
jgi:diacylglycerol kinase (ATP)